MKSYGTYEDKTGILEINKKKHKGDISEEADSLKHELYHRAHPKATEKKTYAITKQAMKEMTYAEKEKLAAKVRNKKNHYSQGALKRKFKMKPGKVEPGAYISRMNDSKVHKKTNPAKASNFKLGVEALL